MSWTCGLLIVDNSELKRLESVAAQARLSSNLRVAGWKMWPTALNFLEAVKNENERVRERSLRTLQSLCGNRGLLPWPHNLLELTAQAVLNEEARFKIPWSGYELALHDGQITDVQRAAVERFLNSQEARFQSLQEQARAPIQDFVRRHSVRVEDYDASRFLDEVWRSDAFVDSYIEDLWRYYEFPEPAPIGVMRRVETWMLYFDAYGVVAYERAFLKQRRSRVQLMDMLHMLYLGLVPGRKRAIASNDGAFKRAGNAMLKGRWARAEVCSVDGFLA